MYTAYVCANGGVEERRTNQVLSIGRSDILSSFFRSLLYLLLLALQALCALNSGGWYVGSNQIRCRRSRARKKYSETEKT